MAGEVRCRKFTTGTQLTNLDPDICPARSSALHQPSCIKSGWGEYHANWCPFALAGVLGRGGSVYDLHRGTHIVWWLGNASPADDAWSCICLRKESAGTIAGAVLRP